MAWLNIHGHDAIAEQFRRSLAERRLASTFLFVGQDGIGKATFARRLAQCLLCSSRDDELLDACGQCSSCLQLMADAHPDLRIIRLPEGKNFIPVEHFVGRNEHRMREGLCHEISLKPLPGSRKIAIIEDADYLNREGANCLLKTLEEPPPRAIIILIGVSEQRQLPTIRSRAQVIRFRPLSIELVSRLLVEKALITDASRVEQLARLSEGSLSRALDLSDPDRWEFRSELLQTLSQPDWKEMELVAAISRYVDSAGKEAAARRARLRQVIEWGAQFFRQVLRVSSGVKGITDSSLEEAVSAMLTWWTRDNARLALLTDECLGAVSHIEANANQATLIASWVDEVAGALRSETSQ